jgi:hypothetical protein
MRSKFMKRLDQVSSALFIAALASMAQAQQVTMPSVTFPLGKLGGQLGTSNLSLLLSDVNIYNRRVGIRGSTMLQLYANNNDVPTGSYKVRFAITQSAGAGVLEMNGNGVQSNCAFTQQLSYRGPVQNCEIGPFPVGSDGKLVVAGAFAGRNPSNLEVGDITVFRVQ